VVFIQAVIQQRIGVIFHLVARRYAATPSAVRPTPLKKLRLARTFGGKSKSKHHGVGPLHTPGVAGGGLLAAGLARALCTGRRH
jgi:hypothetical protein